MEIRKFENFELNESVSNQIAQEIKNIQDFDVKITISLEDDRIVINYDTVRLLDTHNDTAGSQVVLHFLAGIHRGMVLLKNKF